MRKGEPYSPPPPHGTYARYVSHSFPCHCDDCKAANTKYMQEYRERNRSPNVRKMKKR